jgi:putative membrane protein
MSPAPESGRGAEGRADPRVEFARLRTSLALDRTTLAWIRTALTFASFGLGMIGFFRSVVQARPTPESEELHRFAIGLGVSLLLLGLGALVVAAADHWRTARALRRGETPGVPTLPLTVAVAVLTALCCLYGLWVVLH